jgi:hypothetical protein
MGLRPSLPGTLPRVPPDSPPGQPAFRYLERSRRPSAPESRLLSWLAEAVGQELVDQAADATVVGECTCGCSSVRLSTPAVPLPEETTIRLSDSGRADHLAVSSSGRGPDGHVSLVLHVVEGRLYELELFAGEDVAVDPATVTALTLPEIS